MAAPPTLSLSDVAYYGRQSVKVGIAFLVVFTVGRLFLSSAIDIYKRLNPAPPPPPTRGFGLLPRPSFPTQSASDRPTSYRLESVGQQLPGFGDQAPVFFMPSALPSLVAFDRAREKASALRFQLPPEKVSNTLYRWRRSAPIPATLEIDVVYGTINLKVDWPSSPSLLEKKQIPTPQSITTEVRTLLRNLQLDQPDIATASPQITYVRAVGGEVRPVQSISEADFIRVDVYRSTPLGVPTITHRKGQGVFQILFSGSRDEGERILSLESNYVPVDQSTFETYPLQSAAAAWQQLQAGAGYVTDRGTDPAAVVRTARLAYYEPASPQEYFQPVYVFEGDNGFQAIVPAVSPENFISPQGQ